MAGGRRLGKSEIGAGELDIEAVVTKHMLTALEDSGKRREFWIVGPGYTDSEKEFRKHYDAMKRTGAPFDRPGTYYDAHAGDMQLSMFGGTYLVIGKSAMHPERLVGEGLAGVIMAEAAKQKERTWTKFIRPTLADEKGFKRFDEEVHVGDFNFDPNKRTYAAVDYGFTNPFVWLLIQEDIYGNVTVLDELYESGLSIDDAARKIDQRGLCPGGMIEFYPDPASPGDTLALERHLKVRANSSTGGELNIRLRMIREALKDVNTHLPTDDPLRHPKLQFDRKCVNTIREMNDYRYPETSKEQKRNPRDLPLDKDNHGPEALGRFYRGRYGDPGATPAGGSRVADSTMSRGRRTRRSNPYA
jgi:hypothetical protein